jgi:hypothetical protein
MDTSLGVLASNVKAVKMHSQASQHCTALASHNDEGRLLLD